MVLSNCQSGIGYSVVNSSYFVRANGLKSFTLGVSDGKARKDQREKHRRNIKAVSKQYQRNIEETLIMCVEIAIHTSFYR